MVEPDGPTKLTVANAIADRDALKLCFLSSPADAADPAEPYPDAALGFAHATAIALPGPIPAGDVEVVALSGDLASLGASERCRDLADDPGAFPGVDVLSLGVLPASTFAAPRSMLLAVGGCLGGAGHDDPDAELACGAGYTADTPTPTVVFAPLSRVTGAGIGLQVVHAVAAPGDLVVSVVPGTSMANALPLVPKVVQGQAAPFPPSRALTKSTFGAPSSAKTITWPLEDSTAQIQTSLSGPLSRGTAGDADFADGQNIVLLAVGAGPGAPAGFWHDLDYVVLKADP